MKKFWQVPICGIILILPLAEHPKLETVRSFFVLFSQPLLPVPNATVQYLTTAAVMFAIDIVVDSI